MSLVAIIIPCFNEEFRFSKKEFADFIVNSDNEITVCLVNDGSKDNTLLLLTELSVLFPNRVVVLDLPKNVGKAEAVRAGLLHMYNRGNLEYLAYLDADFATPPSEIIFLIDRLKDNNEKLFAMGARWQRLGSSIERSVTRHYLGRIFATFASLVLDLKVYDTQCGAKVLHNSLIPIISANPFMSKWLFDVEVIARIINKFGSFKTAQMTIEVPLNVWKEKGGSKLKLSDLFKVPFELLKIRKSYFTKNKV
jgi:dolichyl-phosphate beta-glucosyltransferase